MARQINTWKLDAALVDVIQNHLHAGVERHFPKGNAIYMQGSVSTKFYYIVEGIAQVSVIRDDGSEMLLEFMGPQTVIGEGSAFDGLMRFSSAYAVQNTKAIEFDAAKLTEVFRNYPEFAQALLRVTSIKQRILAIRLEHLVSREPEERIMELFNRLGTMFSTDEPFGKMLITKLTHEEIAAMTGVSRVTVTRSIQRLRDQGVIDIVDGHLVIKTLSSG